MVRPHLLVMALVLLGATHADAGGKSDSKVKASAVATKPDADGKQMVTITLEIEKGFYVYANPANNELLEGAELRLKFTAKEKVKADVKYPAGKTIGTKREMFDVNEGTVKIEASLKRNNGDTSPLTLRIDYVPANGVGCFLPETIKLTLPLSVARSIP
jgi:Disulphide bond corrector protein DsbC